MISARTDYDFVSIPDEIRVNGEIMPLRKGAKKNELRGEDPAFLMEASEERFVIWNGPYSSPYKDEMTREIEGDRLQRIAQRLRDDVTEGRYIMQWPSGPVYDVDNDLATSLSLHYSLSNLESSPDDFAKGHPLVQADVAKLFKDTGLLRNCNLYQTWDNANTNAFGLTFTFLNGTEGGANEDVWDVDKTTIYDYRCNCYEVEEIDYNYWYGSWREATASGGNVTLDFSDYSQKYIKPITTVWVVCRVSIYERDWSSGEDVSTSIDRMAAFRVPAAVDGSDILLSIRALVDGAKQLLSHYGFSKKFLRIEGNQSASVRLHTTLPIVEMNNRLRWI